MVQRQWVEDEKLAGRQTDLLQPTRSGLCRLIEMAPRLKTDLTTTTASTARHQQPITIGEKIQRNWSLDVVR
tara:strand:+ start:194 stop:409 length:216 start_codon:yes stop_codon:yes gene_type:complete